VLVFLTTKHPLRDSTFWWLQYESAARAGEVLALDVTDLDVPRRRAVVTGKGGRPELIGWETRTARLLPRHLAGREHGPLFLTDLAPASARQPAPTSTPPAGMLGSRALGEPDGDEGYPRDGALLQASSGDPGRLGMARSGCIFVSRR